MEWKQELEWNEAQKISISEDLVAAAKQQLLFLAEVDRHRYLYDGPVLEHAIYRYKYCWLPLLARHVDCQVTEGPLVVPLDCEWIWHCHRLNPVRYKKDCEELYGKIVDNKNVVSSVGRFCRGQTEQIWKQLYPGEPYELNINTHFPENVAGNIQGKLETTQYDLVSAVKRQSSFFYQVSRPYLGDDLFLDEALARYKGFLHLIKRSHESYRRRFCVPTYDIDLIWHSHQLHPASYCKDLIAIIGTVLEHDDTDSDRTMGKKLDVGFSGTTRQWEETFGSRYWRAGAIHREDVPSPLETNLSRLDNSSKKAVQSNKCESIIQLPKKMLMEVMLEIVGVRDISVGHEALFVVFSKKQDDVLFNTKRRLSIFSEAGERDVAVFHCEPNGELVFELMSYSPSDLAEARSTKLLGTTSISLQELMSPISQLSVEKWFKVVPNSGDAGCNSINLRIALSFTPPTPAPYLLHMVQTCLLSKSCLLPLPERLQRANSVTVLDEADNGVITMHIRDSMAVEAGNDSIPKKEVIGTVASGKTVVLAEFRRAGWFFTNWNWWLQIPEKFAEGNIFELASNPTVIIFPGRKLDYEINYSDKQKNEHNFMTVVEFSTEVPYGKAVALLNLKSGILKIKEECLVLPITILAFLLCERENLSGSKKDETLACDKRTNQVISMEKVKDADEVVPQSTKVIPKRNYRCLGRRGNEFRAPVIGTICVTRGIDGGQEVATKNNDGMHLENGKHIGDYGSGCASVDYKAGCIVNFTHKEMVKSGACGGYGGGCGGCGGGCGGGGCRSGGCGGGDCRSGGCGSRAVNAVRLDANPKNVQTGCI